MDDRTVAPEADQSNFEFVVTWRQDGRSVRRRFGRYSLALAATPAKGNYTIRRREVGPWEEVYAK